MLSSYFLIILFLEVEVRDNLLKKTLRKVVGEVLLVSNAREAHDVLSTRRHSKQPSLVENTVFPLIFELLVSYFFDIIYLLNEGRERLLTVPKFQS